MMCLVSPHISNCSLIAQGKTMTKKYNCAHRIIKARRQTPRDTPESAEDNTLGDVPCLISGDKNTIAAKRGNGTISLRAFCGS